MNAQNTLYCPVCLGSLDKNGDCWPRCEYEADHAMPGREPLTHTQVLKCRIQTCKTIISELETTRANVKNALTLYQNEYQKIKEQTH